MPISAPGNKDRGFTPVRRFAEHGFTLVEQMVVITIIGLASAAAVLAMPDPRGRLFDEASRFALRVRGAHDAAIVEARPVSVWVTPGGYGFDQWRGSQWTPIAEKPLRVEQWKEGTVPTLRDRTRVTFDATGMADRPLALALRRERVRVNVAIDIDGSVEVDE